MNRNDQEFIAQNIRAQYTEKKSTELETLRALDAKAKRPANVFAYTFGGISAIIMGTGMSLVMTDIGATLGIAGATPIGVVIGIAGMAMALINYPIYKKLLTSRKKKYAKEIMELSDKIINK